MESFFIYKFFNLMNFMNPRFLRPDERSESGLRILRIAYNLKSIFFIFMYVQKSCPYNYSETERHRR